MELARLWRDLGKRLDGEHVAILMTRGLHCHWTVAYAATESTLRLIDSKGRKILMRSRCTVKEARRRFQLVPSAITLLGRGSEW